MQKINIYISSTTTDHIFSVPYGSYGVVLQCGSHRKLIHGVKKQASSNKMLLEGLLDAFDQLKRSDLVIEVYCASTYLIKILNTKVLEEWSRQKWHTKANKPVANQSLLAILKERLVYFQAVRATLINAKSQKHGMRWSKYLSKRVFYTTIPLKEVCDV